MSQTVIRGFLALGVILAIGFIAASALSRKSAADIGQPPLVYICRESKEIFFSTLPSPDLVHPDTGKATLAPAIFCPQCETWQPAPPAERLYQNAKVLLCPKCQSPRSFTGELPADAAEL